MNLLYVEHASESSVVFGLLMISYTAVATTYLYGTLLTANGNLRQLNLMAAGAMALNVSLNLILIPAFQAAGAGISSLATQAIAAIVQAVLSYRLLQLKPDLRYGASLAAFLILSAISAWLLRGLASSWPVNFALVVSACMLWSLLLGVIRPRSLYRVLVHPAATAGEAGR
jgi:O-antigen/teichoic acid export membrane protein